MGKLLPRPNAGLYQTNIAGDISFQAGRIFPPTTDELPTVAQAGDIVFLDDEGLLAIASGGSPVTWHTYTLSGIIPEIEPTDIPDLVFWFEAVSGQMYDSTNKDVLTESGNVVVLWNDKSGNGNDANQFIAGGPTFEPSAIRPTLDSVQFAADAGMNVSGISTGMASGADPQFTYFAFLKWNATTKQEVFHAGNLADQLNFIEIGTLDTTEWGTRKADDAPSIAKRGGPVANTSGLYLLEWSTQGGDGQTISIWQNGSGIIDQEAYTTSQNTYEIDTFSLGGIQDGGGEATTLAADVVELIAYSGQISNDARIQIQQYFYHKYTVEMSGII